MKPGRITLIAVIVLLLALHGSTAIADGGPNLSNKNSICNKVTGANASVGDVTATGNARSKSRSNASADNSFSFSQEDNREYPGAVAPGYMDFVFPFHGDFKPGVRNPFGLGKKHWTSKELLSYAAPSRTFRVGWPEWKKHFDIEMSLWTRGKKNSRICVIESLGGDFRQLKQIAQSYDRMGNPHSSVRNLKKDAYQLAAATAYLADERGADLLVFVTSDTIITLGDAFQLGGGATNAGVHNALSGIFGMASGKTEPKGKAYIWCVALKLKEGATEPTDLLEAYRPNHPEGIASAIDIKPDETITAEKPLELAGVYSMWSDPRTLEVLDKLDRNAEMLLKAGSGG